MTYKEQVVHRCWSVFFLALMLWLLTSAAMAEQRTFIDRQGSFSGSATTRGPSTSYRDRQGHFEGSSIRRGNSTTHFDGQGRYMGRTIERK